MELTGYIYSLFYQLIADAQREGVGKLWGRRDVEPLLAPLAVTAQQL